MIFRSNMKNFILASIVVIVTIVALVSITHAQVAGYSSANAEVQIPQVELESVYIGEVDINSSNVQIHLIHGLGMKCYYFSMASSTPIVSCLY